MVLGRRGFKRQSGGLWTTPHILSNRANISALARLGLDDVVGFDPSFHGGVHGAFRDGLPPLTRRAAGQRGERSAQPTGGGKRALDGWIFR